MSIVDDEVWINLKILAKLQTQTRVNTAAKLFQHEDDSVWTSLRRSLNGSSRAATVDRINELVETCRRGLDKCQKDIGGTVKARLVQHLHDARLGIENLKKTYDGDATTQAALDRVLDKVDDCTHKK